MERVDYPNTLNNKVSMKAGMIAGFIASAISGLVLAGLTALSLAPDFNFVIVQGSIFGLAQNLIAAWIVYFIIGTFIWGNLYAASQGRFIKNDHLNGLTFGIFIWLIIMIIMMPVADAGIFSSKYGLVAAIVVLITDLVFGIVLGYFYNILRRRYNSDNI